jgi:hypothetical protein
MKNLIFLILLLHTTLTHAQNIDTLGIDDVVKVLGGDGRFVTNGVEVVNGGFIWLGGRYEISDFRVEGETVLVESKTLSLTMIFLNGERCLVSVFKFPNGVLRSYYNQDKIKEDE